MTKNVKKKDVRYVTMTHKNQATRISLDEWMKTNYYYFSLCVSLIPLCLQSESSSTQSSIPTSVYHKEKVLCLPLIDTMP